MSLSVRLSLLNTVLGGLTHEPGENSMALDSGYDLFPMCLQRFERTQFVIEGIDRRLLVTIEKRPNMDAPGERADDRRKDTDDRPRIPPERRTSLPSSGGRDGDRFGTYWSSQSLIASSHWQLHSKPSSQASWREDVPTTSILLRNLFACSRQKVNEGASSSSSHRVSHS